MNLNNFNFRQYSPAVRILIVAAFFIIAGFLLSHGIPFIFDLFGHVIGFIFRFGIPLLIAYYVVKWLQNRSNRRDYRR